VEGHFWPLEFREMLGCGKEKHVTAPVFRNFYVHPRAPPRPEMPLHRQKCPCFDKVTMLDLEKQWSRKNGIQPREFAARNVAAEVRKHVTAACFSAFVRVTPPNHLETF